MDIPKIFLPWRILYDGLHFHSCNLSEIGQFDIIDQERREDKFFSVEEVYLHYI